MRKLLTTLTALTLIGGVLLGAPARTLAVGGSAVYWISTASVGAGTSCASPTHQYATVEGQYFNDLLDLILADVDTEDYDSVTIAICDADNGAAQVYEMDFDTDATDDVSGAEITILGVQWDATGGEEDLAGTGDVIIDGNGSWSPFEFENADVNIGYLTIDNAFDDDEGAAIHVYQNQLGFIYELKLEHVAIDNASINSGDGAGVYAEGIVTIIDSTFTNNDANDGSGGAIYVEDAVSVTIANSTFTSNAADVGPGGAIYVSDAVSVTISDSVFGDPNDTSSGNLSDGSGGDVFVYGGLGLTDLSISNSQFYDAYADDSGGSIAAICAESVISGVTISGAETDNRGAGLYFDDDSGCTTDYTVTVSNSRFLSTDASDQGGAISDGQDDEGPLTEVIVSGSYFYQNEADSGAAINLDYTNLTVSNSTFIENHATQYGGGAFELYNNETVTITGSRFDGNTSVGSSGGVIRQNGVVDSLRLVGNTFTQNTTEGSGGVIYAEDTESLTIESNKFQRNTALEQGGAIRVQFGTSGTSITSNTFTGNSAEQGGAVSINDGYFGSYLWSITRNTFTKNHATLNGGALHMALDNSGNVVTPNVKKNRFRGNSAPAAGAVVVESDYGTGRVILRRYERGLRGNSFQANRGTSDRRSANIGVHFDE
jgi:predicted outer membrane repeat protein